MADKKYEFTGGTEGRGMNALPKPVWTKAETLAHYRQMCAEAATFHDHRDRDDPMVKREPSRPDHDLDARGNPLRPGT